MPRSPVIAVIGAGFTGTLTALQLLRTGPADAQIYLIDKSPGLGRGLAYGTHNPNHWLNVRAGNMSAFPDQSDHLIRWLTDRRPDTITPGADAFITRGEYGDYLSSLLREAIAGPDGARRLVIVPDQAVSLSFDGGGARLGLAMGHSLSIDAAVLAIGNLPPAAPRHLGLEALDRQRFAPDPWASDALEGLEPDASVLLLGSGLTMVDIALDLVERGHRGALIALSRRGLAPHRHATVGPVAPPPGDLSRLSLSAKVRRSRVRAAQVGWRAVIDELRPIVQSLWRDASPTERARFLRHLRPWWDVHRHRMAPVVADQIDALRAEGRLRVLAGRLLSAQAEPDGVSLDWRARGQVAPARMTVGRIINCTGTGADMRRAGDPLLTDLLDQGAIRPNPMGLGLDIDATCQVIGAAGQALRPLYAAGPITQGYAWEVTAVPDIRNQVADLAATLTARLDLQARRADARVAF